MTFTFTLDAFPDYTKFNKTQKVFADIQVITEAVETVEDRREPCVLFSADIMGGARISYDNNGTESLIKLTAEGSNVLGRTPCEDPEQHPEESYVKSDFGDLTEKGDFVQVNMHFNDLKDNKTYTVVQTNPALKNAYPDDVSFQNGIKEKDYPGDKLSEGYSLLLGTTPGLVIVNVVDKAEDKIIQTAQISNKVSFRKSCQVTIKGNLDLITDKKVNDGESVENITRVYEGDVICLTVSDDTEVTALNGIVKKELTGNIYMITAKAADIMTITVAPKTQE